MKIDNSVPGEVTTTLECGCELIETFGCSEKNFTQSSWVENWGCFASHHACSQSVVRCDGELGSFDFSEKFEFCLVWAEYGEALSEKRLQEVQDALKIASPGKIDKIGRLLGV